MEKELIKIGCQSTWGDFANNNFFSEIQTWKQTLEVISNPTFNVLSTSLHAFNFCDKIYIQLTKSFDSLVECLSWAQSFAKPSPHSYLLFIENTN